MKLFIIWENIQQTIKIYYENQRLLIIFVFINFTYLTLHFDVK